MYGNPLRPFAGSASGTITDRGGRVQNWTLAGTSGLALARLRWGSVTGAVIDTLCITGSGIGPAPAACCIVSVNHLDVPFGTLCIEVVGTCEYVVRCEMGNPKDDDIP
jgi:hypothetical protein